MNIFEQIKFENEFDKPVDNYFRKILIDIDKMNSKNKPFALSMYECMRQLQGYIKYFNKFPKPIKERFLVWLYSIYMFYSESED